MNGTGFVSIGADDHSVVPDDATLTGSERVDSLGPQPAEPVPDEMAAYLEVVSYEAGDGAVTTHAARLEQ